MKKYIIGAGLLAGMMLLSGCTQPSFDPGNKTIRFVNGKPYAAPYATNQALAPIDSQMAKSLRKYGVPCSKGDITWISTSYMNSIMKNVNPNDVDGISRVFAKGYAKAKAGCAKPLNKQEYQYWMNKGNQNAANSRASAAQAQAQQNSYNNQIQQNNMQMQNRTNNIMRNVTNTNIRMSNGYY